MTSRIKVPRSNGTIGHEPSYVLPLFLFIAVAAARGNNVCFALLAFFAVIELVARAILIWREL
jgi:hypothetical protein